MQSRERATSDTRILMINVHSCRNAGDAALTLVTLEQLQAHFPGGRITLAMDDPESHLGIGEAVESFFAWVKRDGAWRWPQLAWLVPGTLIPILAFRWLKAPLFALTPRAWRPLLRAYLDADLVISKPGGFLYSSGRGVSLLIALYTLWLAAVAGKPVYMYPQSIGPFTQAWECRAVRAVLNRVRIVMVREAISLEQLRTCGVPDARACLLPDVAFAFAGANAQDARAWLRQHGVAPGAEQPLLGMTLVNWAAQNPRFTHQEAYEAACAAAARRFVTAYGGRVLLFPQVWGPLPAQDDRVPARRVGASLVDLGDAVIVVEDPVAPELLKAVYAQLDLFIGTRMHSNIFALSGHVPTVGIAYQPKTLGIMAFVGLDDRIVSIADVTAPLLVEKLDALWRDRATVRARLAEAMPQIVAATEEAGTRVAADFAAWTEGRGA